MAHEWSELETNTHQDHVIAHVVGASILGYFVLDEAAHLLLDIGFIWTIFVDGEMGLVPQTMAIKELGLADDERSELISDADLLRGVGREAEGLKRISPAPFDCPITEVNFYGHTGDPDIRRIVISCEEQSSIAVRTSLLTGEVQVEA